jgi:Ca-activated chloride channel homolog
MGKHVRRSSVGRWIVLAALLLGLPVLVAGGLLVVRGDLGPAVSSAFASCGQRLKVVAATSYAPVLNTIAPALAEDDPCVRLEVIVADGRSAPQLVAGTDADLWIPDDGAWAGAAGSLKLARVPEDGGTGAGGAGTVVAQSPVYMVTDRGTAGKIRGKGDSWLALAGLLDRGDARMVVRDPGTSGDGLLGAGAMAESVWIDKDMDASALVLFKAHDEGLTVKSGDPALPQQAGDVGLVPEYALVPMLSKLNREAAVLSGKDFAVSMRYTWLPTEEATQDPEKVAAMDLLRAALARPAGVEATAAAGLRSPFSEPALQAPPGAQQLPPLAKEAMKVLRPHHVDHVLSTWNPTDRKNDLLLVVDVSGSMDDPAPGSNTPLIQLVRDGCRSLENLLPDDSRVGVWEFGLQLEPPRDYKAVLPAAPLTANHRQATVDACGGLKAYSNGTGLYDSILGAYASARESYRDGVPNRVLVFTDGRNEDNKGTQTLAGLKSGLAKLHDENRPVSLSVVIFGKEAPAEEIEKALEPVEGYIDVLTTAAEVPAVFIHVAAGGLHG